MSSLILAALLAVAAPPGPASPGPAAPGGAVAEGQPAPMFKLRALDGALVRLDERAYPGKEKSYAKKRPVLIDFFRTDCGPCRTAMPELVKLHAAWSAQGLDVYLIALLEAERGREKLDAYLAEAQLPFPVLVDETEHFSKKFLGTSVALPATYLISREGVVLRARHGGKGALDAHFDPAIREAVGGAKR